MSAVLAVNGQARGEAPIAWAGSAARAWVIPTDEERVTARHTLALLRKGSA